jgi:prepilin-type N-terminal cleavage/methylation domain-containing protein
MVLQQKYSGFTLLELMLVLALVAVLTVAGLAAYQIQQRNFKIDKTALQMQQWLQAGMAFYVDCNQWPPDSTSDTNILSAMTGKTTLMPQECPTLTAPTLRAYMPAGADTNGPWPNSYHIGVGEGAYSNMFQVTTDLPFDNTDSPPGLQAIAAGIAGRLPNASVTADTSGPTPELQIQTAVGIPGSAASNHGYILNMQVVNSNQVSNVLYPQPSDCPKNMIPQVGIAPITFNAPERNTFDSITTFAPQSVSANNIDYVKATLETESKSYIFPDSTSKSGQLLVITACIPNPSPSIPSQTPSNSNGVRF